MAKYDLKFIDIEEEDRSICVNFYREFNKIDEIRIEINHENGFESIYLDKSTAIKFAKTLRTEINKIQD